jgi:CubicO group peptidase (beta-lactamase class C family)
MAPTAAAGNTGLGVDVARLRRVDAALDAYVDGGELPGWSLLVAHRGSVVHRAAGGWRDVERALPVTDGTIFRIYSMTKPITSVAALALFEQGYFELTDPVGRYLPAFAAPRVYRDGPPEAPVTVPATEPIRIWHLLTHTAGLTYGFHRSHPVDAIYRRHGFDFGWPPGCDLAAGVDRLAQLPLLFEPGSSWTYSVATDVLGRLLEVVTGSTLDTVLADTVLGPLGLTHTGFWVPAAHHGDVAACYTPNPAGRGLRRLPALDAVPATTPAALLGGGGLFSTLDDYYHFTRLFLEGGAVDGTRVLAPATVGLLAANQLPGGADLEQFGRRLYAEVPFDGMGFGLGVAVLVDPVRARSLSAAGELSWGGAASTAFWVDPRRELAVVFLTQLLPSNALPLRARLRTLVNQALVA